MLTQLIGSDMVIDPVKLKGVDSNVLAKLLSENNQSITQRLNNTAKELLSSNVVKEHAPAFADDPDFLGKCLVPWHAALRHKVCVKSANGSMTTLVLPMAVYLRDAYGMSCSRFILGCEMPVVPPIWLRNWLTLTSRLSAAEMTQLQEILNSASPVRCDTPYVMKSRIAEMAAERGVLFKEFCSYPGLLITDIAQVRSFVEADFLETGNRYAALRPFLGNHKMLRLLISICVLYQVSPDYLLLQDYSELAVTPQGSKYSAGYRKLMSQLLSAGSDVRTKAIGFVMAATARHIARGEIVPSMLVAQEEAEEQDPDIAFNVMEVYSQTSVSQGRSASQKQMVAILKPKLLAILELSVEPVSSYHLYRVVDGFPRFVRIALNELVEEGKIERVPMKTGAYYWRAVTAQDKN